MAIPCAGVIVFNEDKTLLVVTKCGNYSFPKGKRNSGETDLETAWRELGEETGLTAENVRLFENCHIDELGPKGHPSVRYFIGYIVKHPSAMRFDPNELASVEWYRVSDVYELDKLKTARKTILRDAYVILEKTRAAL